MNHSPPSATYDCSRARRTTRITPSAPIPAPVAEARTSVGVELPVQRSVGVGQQHEVVLGAVPLKPGKGRSWRDRSVCFVRADRLLLGARGRRSRCRPAGRRGTTGTLPWRGRRRGPPVARRTPGRGSRRTGRAPDRVRRLAGDARRRPGHRAATVARGTAQVQADLSTRPGRRPVGTPFASTGSPATNRCSIPADSCHGSSYVDRSATCCGSSTTRSATAPGFTTPRSSNPSRDAGSEVIRRIASGNVRTPRSRVYRPRTRGKVPKLRGCG